MRRADVDASRVGLIGAASAPESPCRSRAKRPVKAIVLVSPYDSIAEVAAATYRWLPVRWLVRHRFDSDGARGRDQGPRADRDGHGRHPHPTGALERLAQLWGGPVQTLELEGLGHNDIGGPQYDAAVRGFLDRHL